MARGADKDGARSSFSVLLGSAPHLDMTYAIFGWVVKGVREANRVWRGAVWVESVETACGCSRTRSGQVGSGPGV